MLRSDLVEIAKQAYEQKPARRVDHSTLIHATPTLKFYRRDNSDEVVLGVRGTYDARDVLADAALVANLLPLSRRYKDDKAALDAYIRANPNVRFSSSSHSLGGAIARQLQRDFKHRFVASTAFNSAITSGELLNRKRLEEVPQERFTTSQDFLRTLAQPFLPSEQIGTVIAGGGHSLSNFDATGAGV